MSNLTLILQVLLAVWQIVQAVWRGQLTRQETDQMLSDLQLVVDKMVAEAKAARASVDDSDDAIANDPDNRDRTQP